MKTTRSPKDGTGFDAEELRRRWVEQWGGRPVYDLVSELVPDLIEAVDAAPGAPVPLPHSSWGDETVGDALRAFAEATEGYISRDDDERLAHGLAPMLSDGGVLAAAMAPAAVGGLRAFERAVRERPGASGFEPEEVAEMSAGFEAAYAVQHSGVRTRGDLRAMRRGLRLFIERFPYLWF